MSGRRLTEEQALALGVRGASVALSAGAGCGKTTVLAERFLRALEAPESLGLGRIVAVTFTNKAARELRQRIRKECRARLEAGDDPDRWRPILRGLVAVRIETFHAFCGQVLRDHAIEAGVDPGFTVLDESIALAIRDQALDDSIRVRLAARDPDLIELAVEFGLGTVRQALEELLTNRSAGEIRDWAEKTPREMVDLWLDRWVHAALPSMVARFLEQARPCLELLGMTDFDHEKLVDRRHELFRTFAILPETAEPGPVLEEIVGLARVQGLPVAKSWPSLEVYEATKKHFEELRKQATKLGEALPWDEPTSMIAAAHGIRFARLAIEARESYDQAKRSRGAIDNDDLLVMTRRLLAEPSGKVREALGRSMDLILVDEFQDTDPVQSEILEHLAGPNLIDGRLFLVGDRKQSIYRFRGAQPELFRDYRERFPAEGRLNLTENFRSVPEVLDFVNVLFARTFPEPEAALRAGGGLEPDRSRPPAITFLWGEPDPSGRPDANARRKEEARRIARTLKIRIDQGWMVRDKESGSARRAHAGDITFLLRSLSDASDYEAALVAEGLDYHVVGGSGFFAQQEVLDLINVLTAVEDPLDPIALAGTLRSPFFSISDDALYWIASDRPGSLHLGLDRCVESNLDRLPEDDRPRVIRARELLGSWRAVKDSIPMADLLDRILDQSGYEAALLGEFLGDRKRANARKLVRMARKFDEPGGFTLAHFVDRLKADLRAATKENQAATTDEQGEIVRLMSIHQAKGLEFPIVVIPDLDRKRPGEWKRVTFDAQLGPLVNLDTAPSDPSEGEEAETAGSLGWSVHRQLERVADEEEALRLFYVATTRARDALILSSATDPVKPPISPALKLLDRQFDRQTGLTRSELPEGWREPRVEVLTGFPSGPIIRSSAIKHRPRLSEVARLIREASSDPRPEVVFARPLPKFVTLDPTFGLSSTAARLDRLVRTILADPDAFQPGQVDRIALRAGRVQDPVSPRELIREAVDRLTAWFRTPLGGDLARSLEVHRAWSWSFLGLPGAELTVIHGQGDFVFRTVEGEATLLIISDPRADPARERLRLRLSALDANRRGRGPIRQGYLVRLGQDGGLDRLDLLEGSEIEGGLESLRT